MESVQPFLEQHCVACHGTQTASGGLDLTNLPLDSQHPEALARWARVRDRVEAGEMPPKALPRPDGTAAAKFVGELSQAIRQAADQRRAELGRSTVRRLSRFEYENTVHELLGIDIPLQDYLPADSYDAVYDTIATTQQMSHFLLEKYLSAADAALDAAYARALEPQPRFSHEYGLDEMSSPKGGNNRMPRRRENDVVAWSTGLVFVGRMPETTVKESGWYRIRVRASAVNPDPYGRVWASLRSGVCYARAPVMYHIGELELTAQPKDFEFAAWIQEGHMIELRPADRTLDRPGYGPIREEKPDETLARGLAGAAIHSLSIERIHRGVAPDEARRTLFGELQVEEGAVVSTDPKRDVARLMTRFASRAFRRPVRAEEIADYVELAQGKLDSGLPFAEALRTGYRALLVSPRFLHLPEAPGELDAYQVASRLSYMLWSLPPDERLLQLAAAGTLLEKKTLRAEIDRLLADERSKNFVRNFTDQWLDLRDIDFTLPDQVLYKEFDEIVKYAMLAETRLFFERMLREDLSVANVVDSDWTYLNARLAKHYGLGFEGEGYQLVQLGEESKRGGLVTHGSVLKVTANGTTTSPVIRGAWVTERILGEEVPPPPPGVPAVEPDIRGAQTIREQLELHRRDPSCAGCHAKIDPPGFALESYDPAGVWRDRYMKLAGEKNNKRAPGPPVDPSYALLDGRTFEDLEGFQTLVADPERMARNMAAQLISYGTGARVDFADEEAIEAIVAKAEPGGYGLRSILYGVVESPLFLRK